MAKMLQHESIAMFMECGEINNMKLDKKMADALNAQFNKEIVSASIYASMAADFFGKNLPGFGMWFQKQAKEELAHAEKIHRYVDEKGERVFYDAIPKPQDSWSKIIEALQAAKKHEEYITASIYGLVETARELKDYGTESFLKWFVDEQVEEESSVQNIIDQLEMVGDSNMGIFQIDRALMQRK
ncbi:MAG: ferritin [Spirochaetales bacterium]|nr:ferritin [Spirochaetales bacterium]